MMSSLFIWGSNNIFHPMATICLINTPLENASISQNILNLLIVLLVVYLLFSFSLFFAKTSHT